ncbi:hypothetical protein [Janibacter sp. GS2]|uniref:hypothetical protein n=1 Tax=Janibacter sp. GS2 TaxID=3442646 RepID=UPI003EB9D497
MDELSARADAVVVGTKGDSGHKESADEEGRSGLFMTTTLFAVSQWIKGDGPDSVELSEMNLTEMEDEIADVRPGGEYVLFLEKVTYKGESRYILVGGVGAYEVHPDGSLSRTETAGDTFPQSYASVSELTRAVNSAPLSWTKTP